MFSGHYNDIQFSVFPAHTILLTLTLKRHVKTNDERKKTYFKANGVHFSTELTVTSFVTLKEVLRNTLK